MLSFIIQSLRVPLAAAIRYAKCQCRKFSPRMLREPLAQGISRDCILNQPQGGRGIHPIAAIIGLASKHRKYAVLSIDQWPSLPD
jgi:hypothetical protein